MILPMNRASLPLCLGSALLISAAAPVRAAAQGDTPSPPVEPAGPGASERLNAEAELLSRVPAGRLEVDLPKTYSELSYDAYRGLRADPAQRLFLGPARFFAAEPIHLGAQYRVPIQIDIAESPGDAPSQRRLEYSPSLFSLPEGLEGLAEGTGFAGMRFYSHDPCREEPLEFLVFHGASYFRGVGRKHGFGTSARALALGTAEPKGEEFPAITRLVLEEPGPTDGQLRVHALLESESVTGVLTLSSTPGEEMVMDAVLTLHPRVLLESAGIAPLTSMFLFDSGTRRRHFDDLRAAVHDADGLAMITGKGERLWRPLANPGTLQVAAFLDDSPRGFGLVQRARSFEAYGDTEARYERRPSAWIEPLPGPDGAGWGPGSVRLVEIPTATEFNDNIVAFWHPKEPLQPGQAHRFAYRIRWCDQGADRAPLARVTSTRTGLSPSNGRRIFSVDFQGPKGLDGAEIEAATTAGEILATRLEKLPGTFTWRADVEFKAEDSVDVAELSVRLVKDGNALSERWLNRWTR